tara:strand:+ start:6469 stop:6831 length:363 start_codon:yes stop_codon:yes gene_type:complete
MNFKYFKFSEFDSPDEPGSGKKMYVPFIKILDKIREDFGKPIVINSGYRTANYNDKVLGARVGSSHKKGLAVDIRCTNSGDRVSLLNAIYKHNIRRVGIAKSFLHIDIDNGKGYACWLYN